MGYKTHSQKVSGGGGACGIQALLASFTVESDLVMDPMLYCIEKYSGIIERTLGSTPMSAPKPKKTDNCSRATKRRSNFKDQPESFEEQIDPWIE